MFFIEVYCFQRFGVMMASDREEIGWMQDILPDSYDYKILCGNFVTVFCCGGTVREN